MKTRFVDYEHYYYCDEIECLSIGDRSFSSFRKRELEYRKYSAYDTYYDESNDCSDEW